MQIYDTIESLDTIPKGLVLSIGNFDGVHLGHRAIIDVAKQAVRKYNAPGLAVMTFHPHPATVLHPEKAPGVLTPIELKTHLLQLQGIEHLIVLKDSFDLLNMSPKDFVDEFLISHVKPAVVVEGPGFNFGYGRSGNIDTLKELAGQRDFDVIVVPAEKIKSTDGFEAVCSSSLVRSLLEKGSVARAAVVLGRPYRLIGETVPGRGIGKRIGFPTANICPAEQIVPAEGVYAGFVELGSSFNEVCVSTQRKKAAFSIGRAKTFVSDHPLMVEAHLLQEDPGDLAEKWLAMDFIEKLRPQKRFETEQQLIEQIELDCKNAKKLLYHSLS